MDSKKRKTIRVIFCCITIICVCFAIFYLIDYIWNGSFVDWFEHNYMITEFTYIPESGQDGIIHKPQWQKLKYFLLGIFVFICMVWFITVFLTTHFFAKYNMKKNVTAISKMIYSYMEQENLATEIFPTEFAEISTQMVEIKNEMQKHERIIKEEAERKNDLIAYLAHDLKTPLTSVIGYLSLLKEVSDMPMEKMEKYLDITLKKAYRLEKLINEFFDITRYNLQQIDLEKEKINLSYMLYQMVDEFYPFLKEHSNTVKLSISKDIIIYGDPDKLARVFNNILKNAISYSYRNSEIEIYIELENAVTKIYFRNKGKTIPKKKLKSIFDKFFRLDDARGADTGGAGLGLAIAREIVLSHGGEIKAESKNEITTFCVLLP